MAGTSSKYTKNLMAATDQLQSLETSLLGRKEITDKQYHELNGSRVGEKNPNQVSGLIHNFASLADMYYYVIFYHADWILRIYKLKQHMFKHNLKYFM